MTPPRFSRAPAGQVLAEAARVLDAELAGLRRQLAEVTAERDALRRRLALPPPPAVAPSLEDFPKLVPPREVMFTLGVSLATVARWADEGKLTPHRTGGGHRRFGAGEVAGLVRAGNGGRASRGAQGAREMAAPVFRAVLCGREDLALAIAAPYDAKALGVVETAARDLAILFRNIREGRA